MPKSAKNPATSPALGGGVGWPSGTVTLSRPSPTLLPPGSHMALHPHRLPSCGFCSPAAPSAGGRKAEDLQGPCPLALSPRASSILHSIECSTLFLPKEMPQSGTWHTGLFVQQPRSLPSSPQESDSKTAFKAGLWHHQPLMPTLQGREFHSQPFSGHHSDAAWQRGKLEPNTSRASLVKAALKDGAGSSCSCTVLLPGPGVALGVLGRPFMPS